MSDENPPQVAPQSPEAPTIEAPIPTTDSTPADMAPVAPEAPRDAVTPVPVEDQNGGINQPKSSVLESQNEASTLEPVQPVSTQPASAPLTPSASQAQSPAQQDQPSFIRALLVKAQAKIQFNVQKKLDKLIQLAQKKQIITNDDVQKLLRVSDATATRYLVKLVGQGRLARAGHPRDAKYQFVR